MSEQTVKDKYNKLIALDKPPDLLDFHRLSRVPKASLSLLNDAPSSREFFTKLSEKYKKMTETSLKELYEDCKQQLQEQATRTDCPADVIRRLDNQVVELPVALQLLEKTFKGYLDEVAERSINQLESCSPSLKETYIDYWLYMGEFLPDLLSWFTNITCQICKAVISDDDYGVGSKVVEKVISVFVQLFVIPLAPVRMYCRMLSELSND